MFALISNALACATAFPNLRFGHDGNLHRPMTLGLPHMLLVKFIDIYIPFLQHSLFEGTSQRGKSICLENIRLTMARVLKLISEINDQTRYWMTKVHVDDKIPVRESRTTGKKYQRITLSDSQGNQVQAIIFNDNISKFENSFYPSKEYYVSNALVTPIEQRYKYVNNEYQWIINNRTRVREVEEGSQEVRREMYNFVSFRELVNYIDMLALIGLSLSTRASTSILINPNIPEALTLHSCSKKLQLDIKSVGLNMSSIKFLVSKRNMTPF
ncbi:hypothetical protein HHK36_007850 [Tetracentron sinense]|uniref:Uncharacterized protein n=1 Tax=Tetracentron sinense TaxID=13715 RepID=A0A834ZP20_TETSI|nr:hypothetical protein HHK36_007850 [Tetracentron sinense]